jgi:hypothetical protein
VAVAEATLCCIAIAAINAARFTVFLAPLVTSASGGGSGQRLGRFDIASGQLAVVVRLTQAFGEQLSITPVDCTDPCYCLRDDASTAVGTSKVVRAAKPVVGRRSRATLDATKTIGHEDHLLGLR